MLPKEHEQRGLLRCGFTIPAAAAAAAAGDTEQQKQAGLPAPFELA